MLYAGVLFFQAEDGIRDLVRSRGLGDVYKRQILALAHNRYLEGRRYVGHQPDGHVVDAQVAQTMFCLLYTSDAADERSSVDLGGRRIIKKKKNT